MAKAAKRRSQPRRKAASSTASVFGLSGWLVAGAVGLAWLGPHFDMWTMPSVFDGDGRATAAAPRLEASREDRAPASSRRETKVSPPRPVEKARPKPVLPPVKAETTAAISAKADPMPALPVPKAPSRPGAAPRLPSAPVPPAPLLTAAIRSHDSQRANVAAPPLSVKPGELAVRRYPFTTSPPVAYVGDLRTIRILGGQGDWKKVEVTSTGATGWLRLQRFNAPEGVKRMPASRATSEAAR